MEIKTSIVDSELPVFAKKAFLSSRSDSYGWISDGKLILPFIIDKRYIFKRLVFTTGIITSDRIDIPETELKIFLDNAVSLIQDQLDVDLIAKAQANAVFETIPDKAIWAPWGTFTKDIQLSDDELMSSIKSKTRNMVRRAMKGNVLIEPASVYELWEVMNETFSRQGQKLIAPSNAYLERLSSNLGEQFLTLKATLDGDIQGVAGIPFDLQSGYYLFGGSIARPYTGALNLLQFEAMKMLRDLGVQNYDFVGARIDPPENSKYYNIQKFKTAFSPELKEGYAFKVVLKPWKYQLMNLSLMGYNLIRGKKYEGDPIDQIRRQK